LKDEGWITDTAFLVDVTRHLNNLNKELRGKHKLITDVCNNIKAFRVKLRLWETQLKLHNLVHFPHLKSLDTIFPERTEEYSQSFSPLLREEFDEPFHDFKVMEQEFLLFVLLLKADVQNDPENLQMELINLQCDTNLNQKFSKQICKTFIPTCQKKSFLCLDPLG
jgi:hypothetical protein